MCEYCGCEAVEAIADLTAEHDRLRELSRELSAAARCGDLLAASAAARAMHAVLEPHTEVEESGLFPALAGDFPEQIGLLAGEHRRIDAVLAELAGAAPASGWADRVLAALGQLFEHILEEQDGVFPAALAGLSIHDWNAVAAVRSAAGSGLAVAQSAER